MCAVEKCAPLPVFKCGDRRASASNVRLLQQHGLLRFIEAGCWMKPITKRSVNFDTWLQGISAMVANYQRACEYFGVTDTTEQDARIIDLVFHKSFTRPYVNRCVKLKEITELSNLQPYAKREMDAAFRASYALLRAATILLGMFSGREEGLFSKLDEDLAAVLRSNRKTCIRAQLLLAEPERRKRHDLSSRKELAAQRFSALYNLPETLLPNGKTENFEVYAPIIDEFTSRGYRFLLEAGLGEVLLTKLDMEKTKAALRRIDAVSALYLSLDCSTQETQTLIEADFRSGRIDDTFVWHAKRLSCLIETCLPGAEDKAVLKAMLLKRRVFKPCFAYLARRAKETNQIDRLIASLENLQSILARVLTAQPSYLAMIISSVNKKQLMRRCTATIGKTVLPERFLDKLFSAPPRDLKKMAAASPTLYAQGVRGKELAVRLLEEVYPHTDPLTDLLSDKKRSSRAKPILAVLSLYQNDNGYREEIMPIAISAAEAILRGRNYEAQELLDGIDPYPKHFSSRLVSTRENFERMQEDFAMPLDEVLRLASISFQLLELHPAASTMLILFEAYTGEALNRKRFLANRKLILRAIALRDEIAEFLFDFKRVQPTTEHEINQRLRLKLAAVKERRAAGVST